MVELGIDLAAPPSDLPAAVDGLPTLHSHLTLLVTPLAHPRFRRDHKQPPSGLPMTRSDRLLSSARWTKHIVGKVSPWLQLDSPHESIRRRSEAAFRAEIAWAAHLGLQAVMLPPPSSDASNYARLVQWACLATQAMRFYVRVPIGSADDEEDGPWACWDRLRTACEQSASLAVALEMGLDLPEAAAELERWCGEPVAMVTVPTATFLTNKKGYPTLSRRHQAAFSRLMRLKPKLVVSGREDGLRGMPNEVGAGTLSAEAAAEGIGAYLQYICFLISKLPPETDHSRLEAPYYDYLQAPLQPLADDLESSTYETFEQDPVKYKQYQAAVRAALTDCHPPGTAEPVVMVLGAGRGPLVDASLVTAARAWDAPILADIIVSELLGSWGDNELSPECLDGAMRYLKPGGLSIPSSYVSTVAPLSSSKLWNEVRGMREIKHFETPYVVKVHNAYQMAESQKVFTFDHPTDPEHPPDNTRELGLTFECKTGGRLHGFVGYFHATLYKDIAISTDPATESVGMFSWFPLYLPLRHPVLVPDGATVAVRFWRCVSAQKVWYEWILEQPHTSPVHNPNGRSYHIGL